MRKELELGGARVQVSPIDHGPEATEAFQNVINMLQHTAVLAQVPRGVPGARRNVKVLVSVDFDAISAWMGTGQHPRNCLSDFSTGIFAGRVGVSRLLSLFARLGVSDKVTWFIPGHSMETFPAETRSIVDSGAEIALHGYCHEDCTQLDSKQEEDILDKCITLAESLTGKRPLGFRAPLYRLRHETITLLERKGFLYDSSLSGHDAQIYLLDGGFSLATVDYSQPAHTWMHPSAQPQSTTVVEIPANWYMEDMTPLQFLPNVTNSHGFVPAPSIEQMWKDRFTWLWNWGADGAGPGDFVFPLVLHPDTSGMAHVAGTIESMLLWLKAWGPQVEFVTYEKAARGFLQQTDVVEA
ncbi:hypothetical protein BGZ61DRAFT_539018 [Ilyonectria robusta]|uniref:uncharacterized protein n=1 Tax=Ilyonectria robusta TaxID=1079257 RepID=UPI001E8D78BF|nr:uncharacterized protein BGZ61DRAFT_539018 [Ilyonectria robusta]KAH8664946.1 hypothetical protein BGZ61DRAFT_539018 [Ilyonectria robusta]